MSVESPGPDEQGAQDLTPTVDYQTLLKKAKENAPLHEGEPETYEQDPVRADVQAYASKSQEHLVTSMRVKALNEARSGGQLIEDAQRSAQLATEARKRADDKAAEAAQVYDQVKGL